ncbi:MAG: HD domain-containing protein [Phycisphaerales bacterium]|nr:HD domain-containing protein [Phycisphaerales bacterium]
MLLAQRTLSFNAPLEAPATSLLDLIVGLSTGLDLAVGAPTGHSIRCAWIASKIAAQLNLPEHESTLMLYSVLLKDAGVPFTASRIHELFGCDDLAFRKALVRVNLRSRRQAIAFSLDQASKNRHVGGWPLHTLRLMLHNNMIWTNLAALRAEKGAEIVREMGFGDSVAGAVRGLHEHFDGGGWPRKIAGKHIPIASRIALVARNLDLALHLHGSIRAMGEIESLSGVQYDPDVVHALDAATQDGAFWLSLKAGDLRRELLQLTADDVVATEERVDLVCGAFGRLVDGKSAFSFGHSTRVARLAERIGRQMGLMQQQRRTLVRAAMLHNIGNLGISNLILEKPGKLALPEVAAMREHARMTSHILQGIAGFEQIAAIAGAHHERPDGQGYPVGVAGEAIPQESKIISVAGVFDALTAERPHRAAMCDHEAIALMEKDRGSGFDPDCLDALMIILPDEH